MFPLRQKKDDTSAFIENSVKMYNGGDSFGDSVKSTVSKLMMRMVVPWLNQCFDKYTDYDFHLRMQEGFSFVQDWRVNHQKRYRSFLAVSRRLYGMFGIRLDEEQVISMVQQLLYERGWQLYQEEIDQMRADLLEVKNEIEN